MRHLCPAGFVLSTLVKSVMIAEVRNGSDIAPQYCAASERLSGPENTFSPVVGLT